MQAPEDIEAILQRLMPVALSDQAQQEMDSIFVAAAQEEENLISSARPRTNRLRYLIPASIAAAAAGVAFWIYPHFSPDSSPGIATQTAGLPGLVLVGASDRIETVTDEGWQDTPEGRAMHTVRLQVVEENTVQDEETGIVMMVTEPREELIMVPVTAF